MSSTATAKLGAGLVTYTLTLGDAVRFRDLQENELTPAQQTVYRSIAEGPRGGVRGPFNVLLRCPELADRAQKLGEYIRYGSTLDQRVMEFAIIIAARHWTSQYEWFAHCRLALQAGLEPRIAEELAQGKRPSGMKPDEAACYQFCTELHRDHNVSDETYKLALEQFGEAGLVDLMGASGYYTMVAMILNVGQKALPEGVEPPLKPLDK
jgi:4-carboxymuconolactone decarboxylase